jgi:hypothetical protein
VAEVFAARLPGRRVDSCRCEDHMPGAEAVHSPRHLIAALPAV